MLGRSGGLRYGPANRTLGRSAIAASKSRNVAPDTFPRIMTSTAPPAAQASELRISKLFRQRIIPNQPIRQGGPGGGLTEGAPASLSPIISTLFSTSLIGDGKPRGAK